jgi:rhodanese-related sulfurtransferase
MSFKNIFRKFCLRTNQNNITIHELMDMMNSLGSIILLDVRSSQEYEEEHLPCSINLPLYDICECSERIIPDRDSIIVVYCQAGKRSSEAIKILKSKGYCNLYNLENGLDGI